MCRLSDLLKTIPRIYFPTFLVLLVGGLCHLIAVTTPYWFVYQPLHSGLWTICGLTNVETCVSIPSQGTYVVMRALSICVLLLVGGSWTAATALVIVKDKRKIAYVVAVGCFICFLASAITDILYSLQFSSLQVSLSITFTKGWSFVLSCLASSLFLIASILGFFMARTICLETSRQGTPGNTSVTNLSDNMY